VVKPSLLKCPASEFRKLLNEGEPVLALAPMQDVTDLPFMRLISSYGSPDVFFTEYFRVLPDSRLDPEILASITQNPTSQPVVAQMIGNDIAALVRTARELQLHPVAAIDLNLGCPVPIVYRKCAGGGLLRDPERVDQILGALREAIQQVPFTVKTRIGFDDAEVFDELLPIFAKHSLDLVTVHARTVKEMYRSAPRYEFIARAVEALPCPVLANGNIYSANKADEVLQLTGAAGLMIGRGVIRNPWLFRQIREQRRGAVFSPSGRDVLDYIRALWEAVTTRGFKESSQVANMKKYMNFIGLGVEPTGEFLHRIRRVNTRADFFAACEEFLDHNEPMPLEPFALPLKSADVMAGEMR